jgi:hypothetical protein
VVIDPENGGNVISFEVRVNGKYLCTAGIGDLGVLTAVLTWVKRDPKYCPEGLDAGNWSDEELHLSVVGSVGHGKHGHAFVNWIKAQAVSVGDEITIKILDHSSCDPLTERQVESSEFVQEKNSLRN